MKELIICFAIAAVVIAMIVIGVITAKPKPVKPDLAIRCMAFGFGPGTNEHTRCVRLLEAKEAQSATN